MKTTIEIRDDLLEQAKKRARNTGMTLRAILESALEAQLARPLPRKANKVRVLVFDKPRPTREMGTMDWSHMRELIYGERETRIVRGRG